MAKLTREDYELTVKTVEKEGGVKGAARALKISERTVRDRLAAARSLHGLHAAWRTLPEPQEDPDETADTWIADCGEDEEDG